MVSRSLGGSSRGSLGEVGAVDVVVVCEGREERMMEKSMFRKLWVQQVLAISMWYFTNGATVILNRYLFMDAVGFKFPLTLTLMHLMTGYVLSSLSLRFLIRDLEPLVLSRAQYTADKLKFASLFVGNIILGNIALKLIPVSFMQTIKSMTPFFTTLFQYLIVGTRYTLQTILSLIPVVFGVVLATFKEPSFDTTGFLAAMLGCVVQATQIVYASKLLGEGKMDTFNTVRFVAPPALVTLMPLILVFEFGGLLGWIRMRATPTSLFLLAASCTVAFLLNLSTFNLLKVVSGVAFSVSGNLKVVAVILVSLLLFRNPVTPVGLLGCLITIAGCTWYGLIKNRVIEARPLDKADVELLDVKTSSDDDKK